MRLEHVDGGAAPVREAFDLVVLSELLEHLDDPVTLLEASSRRLAPGGSLFLDVPINSPAPDHLRLWRHEDEVDQLVTAAGLVPTMAMSFPATGYTLERAREAELTISRVIIASRWALIVVVTTSGPTVSDGADRQLGVVGRVVERAEHRLDRCLDVRPVEDGVVEVDAQPG